MESRSKRSECGPPPLDSSDGEAGEVPNQEEDKAQERPVSPFAPGRAVFAGAAGGRRGRSAGSSADSEWGRFRGSPWRAQLVSGAHRTERVPLGTAGTFSTRGHRINGQAAGGGPRTRASWELAGHIWKEGCEGQLQGGWGKRQRADSLEVQSKFKEPLGEMRLQK